MLQKIKKKERHSTIKEPRKKERKHSKLQKMLRNTMSTDLDLRSTALAHPIQEQKKKENPSNDNNDNNDHFSFSRLWERICGVGDIIYRVPKQRISNSVNDQINRIPLANPSKKIFCENFISQTRIEYFDSPFPSYWVIPKSLNLSSFRPKVKKLNETRQNTQNLDAKSSQKSQKQNSNDSLHLRVLVFFHGTSSLAQDSIPFLAFMCVVFSCLAITVEYPGYSSTHRNKKPNVQFVNKWAEDFIRSIALGHQEEGEKKAKPDLKAQDQNCLFWLPFRFQDIFIIGHSIGTVTALHLASIFPKLGGIVLLSPLTNLKKFVVNHCGWAWNIPLCLLRERIDNVKIASSVQTPILCFCFGDDTDAPYSMAFDIMSAARLSSCRLLIEVKHRTHLFRLDREAYMLLPSFSLFFRLCRKREKAGNQTNFLKAYIEPPFFVQANHEQTQTQSQIDFEKNLLDSFQQVAKKRRKNQDQEEEKTKQKTSTNTTLPNNDEHFLNVETSPLTQHTPHFGPVAYIEKIQKQFDQDTKQCNQIRVLVGITCICLVILVVSLVFGSKKKKNGKKKKSTLQTNKSKS